MQKNKSRKSPRRKKSKSSVYFNKKELKSSVTSCPLDIYSTLLVARRQQDTYTIIMSRDDVLSSSGSGTLTTVYANDPSGAANWSTLAAAFDEYRVLAMRLNFEAFSFHGGNLITVRAPIASVIDYDTSAGLTGYTLANQYSSIIERPGGSTWNRTAYMSGVENAGFLSTMSPAPTFWIKLYSANNSTSLNLANARIEWIVQFRGKGI